MRGGGIQPTAEALHEAAFKGLRCLAPSFIRAENFCADEVLCFFVASRTARDPVIAEYAQRLYCELVQAAVMDWERLDVLDAHPILFIDLLAYCLHSEYLGVTHREKQRLRREVLKRGGEFFWKVHPQAHHVSNSVTLITHYFFERLGFPVHRTAQDVLAACAPLALQRSSSLSREELEQQIYFVTHWVFALSDYGRLPLRATAHDELYSFLRALLPRALASENLELVAEVLISLKIFGCRNDDPRLRRALVWILERQNPDGSWGNDEEVSNRHATCVSSLALYEYRTGRASRWGAPGRRSCLKPKADGVAGVSQQSAT